MKKEYKKEENNSNTPYLNIRIFIDAGMFLLTGLNCILSILLNKESERNETIYIIVFAITMFAMVPMSILDRRMGMHGDLAVISKICLFLFFSITVALIYNCLKIMLYVCGIEFFLVCLTVFLMIFIHKKRRHPSASD